MQSLTPACDAVMWACEAVTYPSILSALHGSNVSGSKPLFIFNIKKNRKRSLLPKVFSLVEDVIHKQINSLNCCSPGGEQDEVELANSFE